MLVQVKLSLQRLQCLRRCGNGYQAAMMAPTAILATQHCLGISKMLEPFDFKCALFTSSLTKKKKEKHL